VDLVVSVESASGRAHGSDKAVASPHRQVSDASATAQRAVWGGPTLSSVDTSALALGSLSPIRTAAAAVLAVTHAAFQVS
jgi:hypothetical protein